MKKLLVLLLCTVCLLFTTAFASEIVGEIEADGVLYALVDNYGETVAVVTDVNVDEIGTMLVVPLEVDGYRVVNIHLQYLPDQIETVCTPDINLAIFDGNPSFTWIVYGRNADLIDQGYEPVEGAADDDLVVMSAMEYTYDTLLNETSFSHLERTAVSLPEDLGFYALAAQGSPDAASEGIEQTADEKQASVEHVVFEGVTFRAEVALWDENACIITGIDVPEGQTTLIMPESLNGKHVEACDLDYFPEYVDTVYMPDSYGINLSNGRVEVTLLRYASYQELNEWGWARIEDMNADDYAVFQVNRYIFSNGDQYANDTIYYASNLIPSIDGRRLVIIPETNVYYECGAFVYTQEHYTSGTRATIKEVNLPDDVDTLIIPPQLDGYPVNNIDLTSFPEQVRVVYAPNGSYINVDTGSAEFIKISYSNYAYVQDNKDNFKNILGEMTENDLALSSVNYYKMQPGSSNSYACAVPADSLLTEIDGRRVLNALRPDYLSYMDGDIEYSFYDDAHTLVTVLSMPVAEGQTVLFVPSAVAGLQVNNLETDFLNGTQIDTILVPDTAWPRGNENIPVLHVYRYYDENVINFYGFTGNHQYVMLVNPGSPTIALMGYTRYEYGDSVPEATIEYSAVPTEIPGVKVLHMLSPEKLTQYRHEDFSYVNMPDGTIAIVKYHNEFAKSVIVPSRLNGLTVSATFGGTYGNDAVFSGDELTTVELPATLTKIGPYTFYGWNINKINVPDSVVEIGPNAFNYVSYKFNSLKLPEGLTTLGAKWASGFGSKLKTVKLPSTVTELPAYCFAYSSFSELKLPDTVTRIGNSAFENMSSLKTLTLPNTLTVIPARMAAASEKLTKITIPEGVTTLGNDAFAGCAKLATITYKSKGALTAIGDGAFTSTGIKKFAPPAGVQTIGKNVAASCASLTSVELPNSVTSIGSYAFSGCAKLTKVTLSEGLTALPEGLFMGCSKLSAITIPASVTEIGEYVFEGCSSKLTISVTAGSFAEEWANANGYKVKVLKAK